jgi:DNA-binding NarL/FixJ family response regulator
MRCFELHRDGVDRKEIARQLGVARGTVDRYITVAQEAVRGQR